MSKGLSCGIVGLPNVGKSTLYNALTRNAAPAENYPFCTIDPNVGVVNVPDPRLKVLADLCNSQKVISASMEFVDIAGLVAGASQGEGLGNKFLANIRETDAILQVVRCFEDDNVVHVAGKVDPLRDIEVINLELTLADLQMIENILIRLNKQLKGKKELQEEIDVLLLLQKHLDQGLPVRSYHLTKEQRSAIKHYNFLTAKPMLYITNVSEVDLPHMHNSMVAAVQEFAKATNSSTLSICGKLEQEISQYEEEEAMQLLDAMGLQESGLSRLIRESFSLLGLSTYITTGPMETRAWTIKKGTTAQEAAGEIHTDIQKGFIRAEVVSYQDIIAHGGRNEAKASGKVRYEGKEYIVQDGDVILFMHN
jgi:GTP-binding protein YchF